MLRKIFDLIVDFTTERCYSYFSGKDELLNYQRKGVDFMKYTHGISEMLDDDTCLISNGKEQIMIKNGIIEFKRVLNESVDAVWNLGSDLDELVMIEWEDESGTFLNAFFTQRVFLEHENKLLKSTLEYIILLILNSLISNFKIILMITKMTSRFTMILI